MIRSDRWSSGHPIFGVFIVLLFSLQLREAYAEIRRLEDDKQRLQMYLEDKDKEADSLTFEIHELEMQLSEEKEEGKRYRC